MTTSTLTKRVRNWFSLANIKASILNISLFVGMFLMIDWFQSSHLLPTEQAAPVNILQLPELKESGLAVQLFEPQMLAGKTTVVYFFAPWCNVCHLSIGNLENLYQSRRDDINVIAVALSYQSSNEIADFVADKNLTFPVLLGTNEVMKRYSVRGFPTYYVLDEQGKVVGKTQGYSTEIGLRLRAML